MEFTIQRRQLMTAMAAAALPLIGRAEDYPSKPIKLVVPFAPGGSSDAVARLIALQMAKSLKQAVLVDNRAGAGGLIGTDVVAKAAPDGYTLLLADSLHVISPIYNRNTTYDPIKDFSQVGMVAKAPAFLACPSNFEATSLGGMLEMARKSPGRVTIALPGSGSIVIEMLKVYGKAQFTLIPYKGGAAALTDLVSGQVHLMAATIATLAAFVKSGKLRLLATTGPSRHPDYPNVPTFAEAGLPGLEYEQWFGMMGPAKLPTAIAETLGTAIGQAVKTSEVREKFAALSLDPMAMGPSEFRTRVTTDAQRWQKIATDAGVKPAD